MQAIHAAGTAYTLTQTPALAAFGTTSPQVYMGRGRKVISARVVLDMRFCTITSPATVTLKLRKTSGTPADLTNAITTIVIGNIGTSGQGETDLCVDIPPVAYNSVVGTVVELWASISALPATGLITVREASILVE